MVIYASAVVIYAHVNVDETDTMDLCNHINFMHCLVDFMLLSYSALYTTLSHVIVIQIRTPV